MARYTYNNKNIDFVFLTPFNESTTAYVYIHENGQYRFRVHMDVDHNMEIEDRDFNSLLVYTATEILGKEAFNGDDLKKEVYRGLMTAALDAWEEAMDMADEEWDDED